VLEAWLVTSLPQVREVTASWLQTYNTKRPHESLGRVPTLTVLPRPASDGLSMRFSGWLRCSNTEPLLRLNLLNLQSKADPALVHAGILAKTASSALASLSLS
jgi:phosphomannomutase